MLTKTSGVSVSIDTGRLEEIADLLDVGLLVVDPDLIIRGWSPWLAAATRKESEDVIGMPLRAVVPDLSPFAETALRNACTGSASMLSHRFHKYLIRVPAPSGYEAFETMQQSARIVPHLGPDGAPIGAVALIEDVTERVAGEEELRKALALAEGANRAKAEFLAAMSHELRTPIGAISGYADLLEQGLFGPIADTHRDPLQRIKSVSTHLLGIVEEILAFARLEAGREDVRVSDTDATTLLKSAVNAVEPLVVKKGLNLEVNIADRSIPVRTDVVKVGQILINLLGNAIKFTDKGGILVSVESTEDGRRVRFVVRDSGEGIAPDQLERIFEPFTQVDSTLTRRREGTGLGLAVSRQLARLLKGDLTVVSHVGSGSTFVLTLPSLPS
ncbi:MAG TPA: ATP-binding protein [Gemmatimonadaceae bacterium]|nr:ATP-binding protein [Gemmatimonadaceae bacterium]